MLQLTTHSPDTCRCVLGYTFDDSVEQDKRESTHKIALFFSRGPETLHFNEQDDVALYNRIRGEQKTKNYLSALAKTLKPDLQEEDYTWSFDESRMLHATFRGMSNTLKSQLRGNLKYEGDPGVVFWDMTGKVIIE